METQFIYILYGVEARKLTDEDVQKNYEIYKLKYNKNITFEKYRELQAGWYKIPINISISLEPIAYFLSKDEALDAAKSNIGDYNDGGVFNYGLVSKLPCGYAYPYIEDSVMHWLFKFTGDVQKGYEPIHFYDNDMTKYIFKTVAYKELTED